MQISHKQGGTPREGGGGGQLWLFDCLELYARTLLQCDSFLCVCLDCMSNCLGEVFYLNSHSAKVFNNFDYWPFASGSASSRNGQNRQKKKGKLGKVFAARQRGNECQCCHKLSNMHNVYIFTAHSSLGKEGG